MKCFIALAAVAAFFVVQSFAAYAAQPSADLESAINAYRVAHQLPALTVTNELRCVAAGVADVDAQTAQPGTHSRPVFTLFGTCNAGTFYAEIAAGNGAGTSAAQTALQFENSPEHASIILGSATAIGCAVATGTFQGFAGFQSWICDFARGTGSTPVTSPVPTPSPSPSGNPSCIPPTCASTVPLPVSSGSASTGTGSFGTGGTGGTGTFQCLPPTCASTIPLPVSSGAPASTGSGSFVPGAPASTSPGTSTSGGAVAGTLPTQCLPPTCASSSFGGR